jgi:hypothetical protein
LSLLQSSLAYLDEREKKAEEEDSKQAAKYRTAGTHFGEEEAKIPEKHAPLIRSGNGVELPKPPGT